MRNSPGWCIYCATPLPPFPGDGTDAGAFVHCPKCGRRNDYIMMDYYLNAPATRAHPGFRCPNCQLAHRKDLAGAIFGEAGPDNFCDRCGYNLTKNDGSFDKTKIKQGKAKTATGKPHSTPQRQPSGKAQPRQQLPSPNKTRFASRPQNYKYAKTIPQAYIRQQWDAGLNISDIVFANSWWFVVMSNIYHGMSQYWYSNPQFPQEQIQTLWDRGMQVSDLEYGSRNWMVVGTSGTGKQRWFTRGQFPKQDIEKSWNDGYSITTITYGQGVWVVVMTQGASFTNQTWITGDLDYVERVTSEMYGNGMDIVDLAYGDGRWVVVYADAKEYATQYWNSSKKYPKARIQEYWDKGYTLTNLAYGGGDWMAVLSKK